MGGVELTGTEQAVSVVPSEVTPEQFAEVLCMAETVLESLGDAEFNLTVSARTILKLLKGVKLAA